MKKAILLLTLLIISYNQSYSQDIIYRSSDNDSIISKILEVNEDNIKYKKYSNLDGPLYTIDKSSINKIVYSNGDIENYKIEKSKSLYNYATVYVIRPRKKGSAMNVMKIYENDKLIGYLRSKTYLKWNIRTDKGEITIRSKGEGSEILRLNNPTPGKTYFIKQSHKMGWVKAKPKIEIIEEVEANELLKKCKIGETKFIN